MVGVQAQGILEGLREDLGCHHWVYAAFCLAISESLSGPSNAKVWIAHAVQIPLLHLKYGLAQTYFSWVNRRIPDCRLAAVDAAERVFVAAVEQLKKLRSPNNTVVAQTASSLATDWLPFFIARFGETDQVVCEMRRHLELYPYILKQAP